MCRELISVNGNINLTFDVDCLTTTQLYKRQNKRCFYCGYKIVRRFQAKNKVTRDHFFPKSKENHLKNNKVLSCLKCNLKKGARVPTQEEIDKYLTLYNGIIVQCTPNSI